jgi:hypothetical protein
MISVGPKTMGDPSTVTYGKEQWYPIRPHGTEAYFHLARGGWVDNLADLQTSPDAPQSG